MGWRMKDSASELEGVLRIDDFGVLNCGARQIDARARATSSGVTK